jgi:predicted ATPase/DNA-binding SARP family transcriptional activator
MEFRILGPLEVSSDATTLDLGGPKQRALLALLVLEANRVVPRDRLIAALWEEEPPETARKALQVYVSKLRKLLDSDRVVTKPPGYLLRVDPGELDLDRFELLRKEGRLDEALALWRGSPLSEFAYERFAQPEITRLEELRVSSLEERIERDLAEGRHLELVGELDVLVNEYPLRERLRSQLMLALYRADRQAEALDAYQQARTSLVDELGIEPGIALRELHQAILNQDPTLAAPTRARRESPETDRFRAGATFPSGTVTLLFADVEGSTRLVHTLGSERYRDLRTRARALVRSAAARNRGHEVDWAGDGAFLAFERARDAVGAALDLQRALGVEPWDPEETLRMRIGIHTGEPDLGDEGYVGLDVHVAARICAAAHGGQVVVSRATKDFVGDAIGGVSFRPLGSHRLRDVSSTQTLFQLVASGLAESFPPLQTLSGATLPALHHRLVGRARNLEELQALIARPDVRLVTITGPGGAGKSRLALEAASAATLERPVHLVGLASISDAALVPSAIARALGVRETAGQALLDSVASALSGTGTLLFLDNLEHLSGAASDIAQLLDTVPDLDVLVTSRSPLRLSGEKVYQLDPLPVDDATTLFVELAAARGARLHDEWLPAVREICARLDGLPLAIELVVAPLAVLPPTDLLKALGDGLALEMEAPIDLPERQRTLRATIDWSYGLLTKCQRELHGMLAVFSGGAPLDSVRVVCEDMTTDLLGDLSALVDGGLVRRDALPTTEPRFTMLATVRDYALEALAANGKLEEMQSVHAAYFRELSEEAELGLEGDQPTVWLERIERDLDNVRGALSFAFESGRVELGLQIAAALGRFWRAHAHVGEARDWLTRGLARDEKVSADVRADALWTAARQADAQNDWDAAESLLDEALGLYRETGRAREVALTLSHLASIAATRSDLDRAQMLCEEALAVARAAGDARATSAALNILASVYSGRDDHERALALHEEALGLRRTLGDPLLVTDSTYNLGVTAFQSGDQARAREAFAETLALATDLGDALHAVGATLMLAEVDLLAGEDGLVEERARKCLDVYTELEDDRDRAECLVVLGGAAVAKGAFAEAARLFGAADSLRGDSPVNLYELPVLERFHPLLEAALGKGAVVALKKEGARTDPGALVSEVVPTVTVE